MTNDLYAVLDGSQPEDRENPLLPSALLSQLPGFVFVKDKQGRFKYVNDALTFLTKISRDKFVGNTDFQVFPKLAAKYWRDDKVVMTERCQLSALEAFDLGDENHILIHVSKSPLVNAAGEVCGIIGTFYEATEHLTMDPHARYFTQILLEQEPELQFEMTGEGHFTSANTAFRDLLGIRAGEFTAKTFYQFIVSDQEQRLKHLLNRTPENARIIMSLCVDIIGRHLQRFSLFLSGQVVRRDGVMKTTFSGHDITSELLKGEAHDLTARSQLLNHFSQTVAHDVKKCLSIAGNNTSLLYKRATHPPLGPRMLQPSEIYNNIKRETSRAVQILDEIQDLSRRGGVKSEVLDIAHILDEAKRDVPDRHRLSNTIEVVVEPFLPKIVADGSLLKRAFENVIRNACDASSRYEEIVVRAFVVPWSELEGSIKARLNCKPPQAVLIVKFLDGGSGIKESDLPHVCKFGWSTSRHDKNEHSGIGLWFCNTIMPIFDGKFSVENRRDRKGCCVQFYFKVN